MTTQILTTPPQSIESEQSILGGLMLDNEKLDDVFDFLERRHFYTHAHQSIFDSMADLTQEGQAIDLVTVRNKLEQKQEIERVGGLAYLDSIIRNTPGTANMMTYAQIVYDRSIEREMLRVGSGVSELLREQKTTQEKLDIFESQITHISEKKNVTGPVRVDACINAVVDEIEARSQQEGLIGLSTGLIDLDTQTSGFEKGDLVVLAGTPGAGKTSLAMNIIEHTVLRENKTALIFSLEMTEFQLLSRAMSTVSGVPFTFIRNGDLKGDQYSKVSEASRTLSKSNLYIDEEGALSVLQMRSRARKVHRDNPLDLIVIDYLQLMAGEGDNTNAKLEKITPAIKSLAKELNVPIILLSQFNREGAKRRPEISDLRGSGSIEQDADTIIMLYYKDGQEVLMPTVEAIIGKQRSGPTGSVYFTFEKSILKFQNGAKPSYTPPQKPRNRGYEY